MRELREGTRRGRGRHRIAVVSGAAGVAVLLWLVARADPAALLARLVGLGPVWPVLIVLAALRSALQTAGWRLALPRADRPGWLPAFRGTVAGEAVGYLAWAGPVAREPIKVLFVRRQVAAPLALSAVLTERGAYLLAAASLAITAFALLAVPSGEARRLAAGLAAAMGLLVLAWRRQRQRVAAVPRAAPAPAPTGHQTVAGALRTTARDLWRERPGALLAIVGQAMVQELTLVFEAFLVLAALGADPTIESVLIFEGVTKLVNVTGLVVPGRVGISEAASAALANWLDWGSPTGVTLALVRRARSLLWSAVGLAVLGDELRRHTPSRPPVAVSTEVARC